MRNGIDIVDRTFRFSVEIVRFTKVFGRTAGTNRTIAGQLLRSGTSVGANVEEAQAAQSRKDFIHKNSIALKEARETRYWLRVIQAAGLHAADPLPALLQEAHELCCILGSIVVRSKQNSG